MKKIFQISTNKKIIIISFALINTISTICQVTDYKIINKIEQISSHEFLYSKDKVIIYKINKESRKLSTCLNTSSHFGSELLRQNQNFTVYKRHLFTMHMMKVCMPCDEKEYQKTLWRMALEIQDLDNLEKFKSLYKYPRPDRTIKISNYNQVANSQELIGFDFYQNDDILYLILSSNNKLYFYKMEGGVKDNNWAFIKTINLKKGIKNNFRSYITDKNLYIFDDNKSYKVGVNDYSIKESRMKKKEREKVVFYDHTIKSYKTIESAQVRNMLDVSK